MLGTVGEEREGAPVASIDNSNPTKAVLRANLGMDSTSLRPSRRTDDLKERNHPIAKLAHWSRQWVRCQPRPQPSRTGSNSGAAPSSIEAGFGASGVACVDAANARLASARINARIFVSAAEPKRAMIGDFG